MKKSIAIICGGGPAHGINPVISTLAKTFLKDDFRVLGVHYGYKGLFSEAPEVKEFDFAHADRIFSRGGSTLIMSRFKPKDSDFNSDFFKNQNVKLLVTIGGDDHGHPELGNVSKSHVFNYLLQLKLKELGIHIKTHPVEIGYELRCCNPIAFDITLCTLLAIGVKKLFDQDKTGCIVSANSNGDITPLYLKDFEDGNGKIPPRLVDIESDMAQLFINNLFYIEEKDYSTAKHYINRPENYNFRNILNWN